MTTFLRRVAALAKLRVISLLVVTGAAGAFNGSRVLLCSAFTWDPCIGDVGFFKTLSL